MTLAATLLFFDPDWPRQVLRWLQNRGRAMRWQQFSQAVDVPLRPHAVSLFTRTVIVVVVATWLVAQVVIPLRHFAAPGNVAWNEDGHRFSWRMKLRTKRGDATFVAIRDDGERWTVKPADYLNARQTRKMVCIPDLLWQFAQFVETKYSDGGQHEVEVYADAMCSLNTREPVVTTLYVFGWRQYSSAIIPVGYYTALLQRV